MKNNHFDVKIGQYKKLIDFDELLKDKGYIIISKLDIDS
jgi:hypothetical protein